MQFEILLDSTGEEFETIHELLDSCGLPHSDIQTADINFLLAKSESGIHGCGAIETLTDCCLLRSVAVDEVHRGSGLGASLTRQLLAIVRERSLGPVYLLTNDAQEYFLQFGFEIVGRDSAPPAVQNSNQFSNLCPDSAHLMRLG
ncbi:MAG: arsenic resistance N-acetyltransferase ArsN2 [Pseudomonadota bacterium]